MARQSWVPRARTRLGHSAIRPDGHFRADFALLVSFGASTESRTIMSPSSNRFTQSVPSRGPVLLARTMRR
jgi:hypothetical protein